MDILQSLKEFYNNEAEKFSKTRAKKRPEFDIFLEYLNKLKKDNLKIIDLGCGDGRLFGYLNENLTKKFTYIGVDISENLIKIAQNRYQNFKNAQFVVNDMESFLEKIQQQSIDVIAFFASFQHIPNLKKRLKILKLTYRALDFD